MAMLLINIMHQAIVLKKISLIKELVKALTVEPMMMLPINQSVSLVERDALLAEEAAIRQRVATSNLPSKFRSKFTSHVGSIAFARIKINEISETLRAFSGERELEGFEIILPEGARRFGFSMVTRPNGRVFNNEFDAEVKILESIGRRFGRDARGEIVLVTKREVCNGCIEVINRFR